MGAGSLLVYDGQFDLDRLRKALPGATEAELSGFLDIAERAMVRARRYGFTDRVDYWREAKALVAMELIRRELVGTRWRSRKPHFATGERAKIAEAVVTRVEDNGAVWLKVVKGNGSRSGRTLAGYTADELDRDWEKVSE